MKMESATCTIGFRFGPHLWQVDAKPFVSLKYLLPQLSDNLLVDIRRVRLFLGDKECNLNLTCSTYFGEGPIDVIEVADEAVWLITAVKNITDREMQARKFQLRAEEAEMEVKRLHSKIRHLVETQVAEAFTPSCTSNLILGSDALVIAAVQDHDAEMAFLMDVLPNLSHGYEKLCKAEAGLPQQSPST